VLFKFKVIVKDDERAFLVRDGRFERLLGPGRFVALDYGRRLTAEVVKVARAEIAADKALLFAKAHPDVAAEHFEIVQAGAGEVAIVSLGGEPKHLILPNTTRAFWKTITKVDVERIDATAEVRVAKRHLDKLDPARSPMVVYGQVEEHEAGLLFVDGKLSERLPSGRHAFWAVGRTVKIAKVDTRPTPLEVTAQEILTKDRVGIRVTLTAFTRVIDPEKAALAVGDVANTLYRLVQFAIREAVATRTLDEILLMEDNPLLLRLKELEALEKLVEKIGRIDLHAGAGAGGFDALLQNLYSLRERADAVKPA
jgi:hypothetical protein